MEANPVGLHPPLPIRSNLSLRGSPKRGASARDQRLQRTHGQDAQNRLSPTNARTADRFRHGAHMSPTSGVKPLLPASQRRAEEKNSTTEKEKGSPVVEGGSVGREGRHFTVANVGQNGQIFLRPAIRPDNQRYPNPPSAFPVTPPSTGGLDPLTPSKAQRLDSSELDNSLWTPTPMTDCPSPNRTAKEAYFDYKSPTNRHRRAVSDSTAHDLSTGAEGSDTAIFKVVISKPRNDGKSRTAEDLHAENGGFLQVAIPSYKLGTPRFTLRGTPLIRGSSYAPTEDMTSSHASCLRPSSGERADVRPPADTLDSHKSAGLSSSRSQHAPPPWHLPAENTPSPRMAKPPRPGFMPANLKIEPALFDALTFEPTCDDRTIVRYSPNTKTVTAATPPRLVAEITSPNFLDYDLISDFFLTFRSFLDTSALLRLLIARLQWTLSQDDDAGMIVKVRTFVALRHWILNYFVDDFVVDYHLRVAFCDLLNAFTEELRNAPTDQKVPLKIMGELKKCWRRVCAQYWDGPEFDIEVENDGPLAPGGIAGHRDPSLTPSFWETGATESPRREGASTISADSQSPDSFPETAKLGQVDYAARSRPRPATPPPPKGVTRLNQQPTSPTSIASLDVVSCSFPTKALRLGDGNGSLLLGAHPADPSSIYISADPIASTPRVLSGKRARPQTSHRRNNSLSDSLREHGSMAERMLYKNAEFLLTLPYSGSLVRGNVLPPGQPFVELDNSASTGGSRHTTLFQSHSTIAAKGKAPASAMSSQGMRKLLGSVRRALSARSAGNSQAQESLIGMAPIGLRGATTNRLPGTAVVPQTRNLPPNDSKQPQRIDVLGAQVAEDFRQAVREDAAEAKLPYSNGTSVVENGAGEVEYSAAHMDSSFELRPLSDAAITTGSKSIVIVDGTAPPEQYVMTGALPPANSSIQTFGQSMARRHGRDPTPPMTPPSGKASGNTPRRSSYILGQHVHGGSASMDPMPAVDTSNKLDPDGSIENITPTPHTGEAARSPPVSFIARPSRKPPSAYLNRHRRQQSSRSYRSKGSIAQRRWASFQSGLTTHSTARSFDATSYSGSSMKSEVMPPPLRMLRRRKPGEDLRGAATTGQMGPLPLRRSRSIGSLTTYSDSLPSSYLRSPLRNSNAFVDVASGEQLPARAGVFSLGAVAVQAVQAAGRPSLSLFSTHSSKPNMRPSFETEAQKLAQIPDDTDDDGGVESALLKLEGKYERKMVKLLVEPENLACRELQNFPTHPFPPMAGDRGAAEEKKKHRHLHIGEDEVPAVSPIEEGSVADQRMHISQQSEISSFLSEDSMETYNSIPLLERGLTDEGRITIHAREWTNHSILEGPDTPVDENDAPIASSSVNTSFEFISRTQSLDRAAQDGQTPVLYSEERSFLDVESDNDSELSSELSTEAVDGNSNIPMALSLEGIKGRQAAGHQDAGRPIGPYLHDDGSSVKLTFLQALQMPLETDGAAENRADQAWVQKPLPPTPTPALRHHLGRGADEGSKRSDEPAEQPPLHLPFILAFDSEILAQQFTLIEKDALNEVDWKELIEMKWRHSRYDSRSWVDFLRNTDARGVEVVIARFNIMVKWAVSEIVLTRNVEERARCIIKLIHIAAHCRRYLNFATMSQIAIALTSNEVGRLSRTWALIPATDMKTMGDLEALVSPTRNFNNLRAEMEGGGVAGETGCIPFVGIYTHDLVFNYQRPSEIASSPKTPPLVNFERCRIAASIVKTLLRLLEASTLYQFQPIEGIIERCLWMSALSDDEIRRRSEGLE
ncbi:ras GEF [Xylariaceae sp. FL0594]|nr:ras GEF [Xylariaceae sp. FL0594]